MFISPFVRDSLKSGLTYCCGFFFLFFPRIIFELHRPIGAKFCTMLVTAFSFIIPVQNFEAAFPKLFKGPKTSIIWPDVNRLRSSAANISGRDKDIQNRLVTRLTAISSALNEARPVKFRPVTLEISLLNCTHQKTHYSEDHISAPRGCCAPKFLHALENDQVLLAHLPPKTWAPLQLFSKGGQKLA